ncbi:dnaJ homolog subfamily C member 5-like [Scyliorhinus canicula]|uniref:dnaJ homolog subfamily C member 5-like n=1 Tax=Scyliorhinus canicula TaxID=7830 RepID=UPI0018F540F3|nr:dnaJ homolog subfamily C member 5-like [Scyliorhinus canicula]
MANRHERTVSASGESLYTILGLQKKSSPEQVDAEYRKLAMRYHPDKNPDNPAAAERFKEISKAKAILSDEKKKRVYDSYGMVGLQLAPMFGKDGENFLASRNICCIKCCGCFCLAITCCCCCYCCCGLCVPKVDPNDWNPNIATGTYGFGHQPAMLAAVAMAVALHAALWQGYELLKYELWPIIAHRFSWVTKSADDFTQSLIVFSADFVFMMAISDHFE